MSAAPPPPTWSLRIVLTAASLLAAIVLIAVWAAGSSALRPGPSSIRVGGAVYTVTNVERVNGLTDADVGGMTHGIQGLVTKKQMMIRVSLTVSADAKTATYDPSVLQVFSADDIGISPLGGSLEAGRLRAHGRIDGSLSFVVARDGARILLRAGNGGATVPPLRAGHPAQRFTERR